MSVIQRMYMYSSAWGCEPVDGQYSEAFGVGVGKQQGSVLSPLPFYADELGLTQEECIYKLKSWKAGMESKGFCVNMKKTKLLVSGVGHDVLKKSSKYPLYCPLWWYPSSAHSA